MTCLELINYNGTSNAGQGMWTGRISLHTDCLLITVYLKVTRKKKKRSNMDYLKCFPRKFPLNDKD